MDLNIGLTKIKKIHQKIPAEVIKFLFVGTLNTTLSYILFFMLIHFLNIHYSIALFLAYCFGVVHSYLWNRNFTFKSSKNPAVEMLKFVLINVLTYFVNLLLLFLFIDILKILPEVSQIIALFLVVVINFLGFKHWAFK